METFSVPYRPGSLIFAIAIAVSLGIHFPPNFPFCYPLCYPPNRRILTHVFSRGETLNLFNAYFCWVIFIYFGHARTTSDERLADGVRFELTEPLRVRQFSRLEP
jgi:hypothetical protein